MRKRKETAEKYREQKNKDTKQGFRKEERRAEGGNMWQNREGRARRRDREEQGRQIENVEKKK